MVGTYLRAMRCPAYRQRDSHSGFRTELETLAGDVKGKGTKRGPREAESTDALASFCLETDRRPHKDWIPRSLRE